MANGKMKGMASGIHTNELKLFFAFRCSQDTRMENPFDPTKSFQTLKVSKKMV